MKVFIIVAMNASLFLKNPKPKTNKKNLGTAELADALMEQNTYEDIAESLYRSF